MTIFIVHPFLFCVPLIYNQAKFNISKVAYFQISPLEEGGFMTWAEVSVYIAYVSVNYPPGYPRISTTHNSPPGTF